MVSREFRKPAANHGNGQIQASLLKNHLFRGLVIGFGLGALCALMGQLSPARFVKQPVSNMQACSTTTSTSSTVTATDSSTNTSPASGSTPTDISKGLILPFERTTPKEYLPGKTTDAYTYFHNYVNKLSLDSPTSPRDFDILPLLHIWPIYFEAYHNHWQRYRGKKEVVFLEIGVQSGGKIPMLRDYFGPGLTYIGVDINPSCKMFESADWNIHIEIGDSGNREFLESLIQKYPKVDIFLDDGGHSMAQQRLAMEIMLKHIQPDGVYMCEDLSTSWSRRRKYQGIPWGDSTSAAFRDSTTVGLVYRTLEWFNAGWMSGKTTAQDLDNPQLNLLWKDTPWWRDFVKTVKHIHYYNQLVVYEKGIVENAYTTGSVGFSIPYGDSGTHAKVQWEPVLERVQQLTNSSW